MSTLKELELVNTSPRLLEVLRRQGIAQLSEFQKDAVEEGITRGRNMILQTYDYDEAYEIAEIAILNRVVSDYRARAIILCPNPHSAEKRFHSAGLRCSRLGIETSIISRRRDAIKPLKNLGRVVITTFRSFSIALRTQPEILRDVQAVLIDRLDLIGQPSLGALLEKSIVTIKGTNQEVQYISVCPPVADITDLSDWLNAEIVVDKKEDINRIFSVKAFDNVYESLTDLTEFVMTKQGQVLLLSASENTSEELTSILVEGREGTDRLDLNLSLGHQDELHELANNIMEHYPVCKITKDLSRSVRKGVGFLHGGVSRIQRKLLSQAWEKRLLPVLVMPTRFAIASGLKAYTVFIMGVYMQRSDEQKDDDAFTLISEWQLTDVLQSAGRTGFDRRAFGIVVVDNDIERRRVISKYFNVLSDGSISPILGEVDSIMDDPENFQDLVLGEICTSEGEKDDPFSVISRTFWASTKADEYSEEESLLEGGTTIESHINQRAVKSTVKRAQKIPDTSVKLVSATPNKVEGLIHSESRDLWHHIILRDDEGVSCTCESWKFQGVRRHRLCKHLVKFMQFASKDQSVSQYATTVIRKSLTGLEILDELEREGLVFRRGKVLSCTELGKTVTLLGIPVKDAKRAMRALSKTKSDLRNILLELTEVREAVPREVWGRVFAIAEKSDTKSIDFCEDDNPGRIENCLEDLQYFTTILLRLIDKKNKNLREQTEKMNKRLNEILDAFS